jgi:hypothetical protein
MKKSDFVLTLVGWIILEIAVVALTVVCFMTCWPVGFATILLGGFIVVMMISTIQQMKGKKPIIKQEKTEFEPYSIPTKKNKLSSFWKTVGILSVIDEMSELDEPPPLKNKSILNSTHYDNDEHLHTEEGHDTEDGYCMECDIAVEDVLE